MTIDHNVIKDLIPSYIDGITSPESNQLIEEHLMACDSCRQYYEEMKAGMAVNQKKEIKKIDPLKKIKRRNRKKIILSVVATAAVLIVCYVGTLLYGLSFMAESQNITERITNTNGVVSLNFADNTKRENIYTMVLQDPDHDLEDGYQTVVTVKQARFLSWDQPIRKTGEIGFTFTAPDTIYLNNGIVYKLTDQDTLTIKYEDKEETIKISELYEEAGNS